MKTNVLSEIGGVILTPEALEQLKHFQDSSNEELNGRIEDLGEIVCLGTIVLDQIEPKERQEQFKNSIINLSYLREKLITLRKP